MTEVAGPLELAPEDWHGYPHTLADVLPAVAGALGVASEGAGPVVPDHAATSTLSVCAMLSAASSISSAIPAAVRRAVPLNSRCSR